MPEKPETKLQKKIAARLRERGAWVTKIHGGIYSSGVPDLLVCYRGRFIAMEVKVPGRSKATRLQAAQLRQIRAARGRAYVVRSVRFSERILDAVDREMK